MTRNITHIAILMVLLTCKLFGQADSGTIVGSVTDPAGAVERPNVVAGCDPNVVPGGRTRTAWINTACYSLPPLGTFGNSGAYTLVGPGLFTVDFGLHRNFSIKEKMRLQVRWETFNTTNHTNFTLGGTTFTAVGSASAGVISSAFSNRVMQVAMKLNF